MTISTLVQVLMIYAYISFAPSCRLTWRGFSVEAVRDWGPYLQVALPGVGMNAEYWVGETLTFAAGLLVDPATCLSALSIYQLTQTTFYQVPSGIRMAVTSRVGSQLGAGQPEKAVVSQRAGLRLVLIWLLLPAFLLLAFTRQWGRIFTDDDKVIGLLDSLVYVLLIYSSMDAVLAYYNGLLASCGQQRVSATWAIRGYVYIGFPLAIAFAFPFGWGVHGLVIGHSIGKFCHTLPCILTVWRLDWHHESDKAVERVREISASANVPLTTGFRRDGPSARSMA
eukprot:TRINITY_DN47436_c0_g1_i1.p1 TRINITY_DN47436_c0_g1~~TRINITY_DN47436_c0_g1_i1.p1  ORF type:complete len:282 (+),score=13.35 TRINITY_DN47436_c0_g1_i1:198-1043(+)